MPYERKFTDDNTDLLTEVVINEIQGQNWTDEELTKNEIALIDMAVRATLDNIAPRDTIRKGLSNLQESKKGKTEQICSICNGLLAIGTELARGWTDGNNARPINDGKCCEDCNNNIVIPIRLKRILNAMRNKKEA